MVNGEVVVIGGRVQTADENELLTRAGIAADAAWQRFAQRYGDFVAPAPV